MAIGQSNSFSIPAVSQSLVAARNLYNGSALAVLRNFYSTVPPGSLNIIIEGAGQATPLDGMLFRDANTGALYVADSVFQKTTGGIHPLGGTNFTRNGIGLRYEFDLANTKIGSYEMGEIFSTIGDPTGSQVRVYIKSANGSPGTIKDIGTPPTNGITTAMLQAGSVTLDKLGTNADPLINALIFG